MTIDITQIVISIIGIVFSALTAWLLKAIVPAVRNWLNAHATETQHTLITTLIKQLVEAAEQLLGSGKGKEKMEYVVEQLKERGFNVDVAMIEAAVKEMNDANLSKLLEE